jgi:hypothetical protein
MYPLCTPMNRMVNMDSNCYRKKLKNTVRGSFALFTVGRAVQLITRMRESATCWFSCIYQSDVMHCIACSASMLTRFEDAKKTNYTNHVVIH